MLASSVDRVLVSSVDRVLASSALSASADCSVHSDSPRLVQQPESFRRRTRMSGSTASDLQASDQMRVLVASLE